MGGGKTYGGDVVAEGGVGLEGAGEGFGARGKRPGGEGRRGKGVLEGVETQHLLFVRGCVGFVGERGGGMEGLRW